MVLHGKHEVLRQGAAPSFIGGLVERRPFLAALGLVALTLMAHALILATPGFFSNDEWQKFDHIRLHGFGDFARAYGTLRAGPEFGYPMRPIGFLQQGMASLWMQSAPAMAHLAGVANHAMVALVFVWVLRRACVSGATAGAAGVLFVLSPLTTMATGWLAASFDQLYVLFLLLAAAAVVRLPAQRMSGLRAAGVLLATAAALLSKETAIVAPVAMLLLGYLASIADPDRFSWRPFGIAFVAALLPVAAYLILRAPAITASIAGHADPAYTPDLSNMPGNAWRFFAFPFRLKLVEMSANIFRSPWQSALASAAHLLLVGAIAWLYGPRFALAYLGGYFIFLLPVLALPNPGAHMLYGSALTMSLALAAVMQRTLAARQRGAAALVVAGVVALGAHAVTIQRHLLDHGRCQQRFLASVDALLAKQAPDARRIIVVPDDGALVRVAIRAVAAREAYTVNGHPIVTFDAPGQRDAATPDGAAPRVVMTAACLLRTDSATARD
jgi:hypothetical protein